VLKKSSDDSVVETIDVTSPAVTIAEATATIDPSVTLDEVTGYYVEVDAGAFEDLAGNDFPRISGSTTWNFTTGDFTAPTVTGAQVGNGSTQRSTIKRLQLAFIEDVSASLAADDLRLRNLTTGVDVRRGAWP